MNLLLLFILGVIGVDSQGTMEVEEKLDNLEVASFAGGCFWCTESHFEHVEGVRKVISGYTGGNIENPSYKQVSSGKTNHIESIQVYYEPHKVTYEELLEHFWKIINPTDDKGQFVDRGQQYTTAIFYHNEEQKKLAEASKVAINASGRYKKEVITPILPLKKFYEAEEYHQDYYKKNPVRYKTYRHFSGRDQYLEQVWGKDNLTK